MTATTALTAQNTLGVQGIHVIPAEFVAQQIEACIDDIGVDVIKTGGLYLKSVRGEACADGGDRYAGCC
jgi:hydroxymethylpyrimidine/phosphomethylpyrimidine kinase